MDRTLTVEHIAHRFEQAAATARGLPPARVQGYFNSWPQIVRQPWEVMAGDDEPEYRPPPASPKEIDRMLEVHRWLQWLDVNQRHIVLLRSKGHGWQEIGRRFGCDRTTAWRRWNQAVEQILVHLRRRDVPGRP